MPSNPPWSGTCEHGGVCEQVFASSRRGHGAAVRVCDVHVLRCLDAIERYGMTELVNDPDDELGMEHRLRDSERYGWTVENFEPLGNIYAQVHSVVLHRFGQEAAIELALPDELDGERCPLCLLNARCACTQNHDQLIEIAAESTARVWHALMFLDE